MLELDDIQHFLLDADAGAGGALRVSELPRTPPPGARGSPA